MENAFIKGFVDSFRNWKALLLNIIFVFIVLIICYFFISGAIENLIILSATHNLTLWEALGYYFVITPLKALVFVLSWIVCLFIGALVPTITLNLFEKKPILSNYWKVLGLLIFIFLLGAVTTALIYIFSFNVWALLIFFILFIIFWLFLAIRLFFVIPNLVYDGDSFKEAWENAKEKVKGKYANIIIIIILFLALLNVVDGFSIALYSYYLPLYGYYIVTSLLGGLLVTWVLMTMYHKY